MLINLCHSHFSINYNMAQYQNRTKKGLIIIQEYDNNLIITKIRIFLIAPV